MSGDDFADEADVEAKSPNEIDKHVGLRVRWRRKELKLSQEALAGRLGLTFQQIQKYERGTNRISAGRLYELARALDASIMYFYRGVEEVSGGLAAELAEDADEFAGLIDADAVELVSAFHSIPDLNLRKSILAMVRKSAEAFNSAPATADENT